MLTQTELITALSTRYESATVFQKVTKVYARIAKTEEEIATIIDEEVETTNTAHPGDYIVKNQTEGQEEYVVKPEKFLQRYTALSSAEGEWKEYQAQGKCRAIELSAELIQELFGEEDREFVAPWGTTMICHERDFLCCPNVDGAPSEVYRIAREEFKFTYAPIETAI